MVDALGVVRGNEQLIAFLEVESPIRILAFALTS